jgi:hypothetical protein
VPIYAALRVIPSTRDTALRLGLVTRAEMIAALISAIESPPEETMRVVEVPDIRRAAGGRQSRG